VKVTLSNEHKAWKNVKRGEDPKNGPKGAPKKSKSLKRAQRRA
jgi:hypothetical protein